MDISSLVSSCIYPLHVVLPLNGNELSKAVSPFVRMRKNIELSRVVSICLRVRMRKTSVCVCVRPPCAYA